MELKEKERMMLEGERDKIRNLSMEILELENDPKNGTKLKQRVIGIQASVNKMSSYSNPEQYELENLTKMAENLMMLLSENPSEKEQKAMNKLLYNPSKEVLKKYKIRQLPPLNATYPVWWSFIVSGLDTYCNYVNAIRFDFTKKGLSIVLPKIVLPKNFNLGVFFNISNSKSNQ